MKEKMPLRGGKYTTFSLRCHYEYVFTSFSLRFYYDYIFTTFSLRYTTHRSYAQYLAAGTEAEGNRKKRKKINATKEEEKLPEHVNGVKGLWVLNVLPYAALIHWTVDMMHTFNNVVHNTIDSMRPTYTQNTSGRYYPHKNRTYHANVQAKCKAEGIFLEVFDNNSEKNWIPPWCLTKKECLHNDKMMHQVIGCFNSDDIPLNVFRAGKAQKSHDTIQWAHIFSPWILRRKNVYENNILNIFEAMAVLNSNQINLILLQRSLFPDLIKDLVDRSGLVPPSECCITLHELIHICEQVKDIGNPRFSSLYKFEKMNKVMKGFIKNQARGIITFSLHLYYIATVMVTTISLHFYYVLLPLQVWPPS
jgi:hypothetical protein